MRQVHFAAALRRTCYIVLPLVRFGGARGACERFTARSHSTAPCQRSQAGGKVLGGSSRWRRLRFSSSFGEVINAASRGGPPRAGPGILATSVDRHDHRRCVGGRSAETTYYATMRLEAGMKVRGIAFTVVGA